MLTFHGKCPVNERDSSRFPDDAAQEAQNASDTSVTKQSHLQGKYCGILWICPWD